MCQKMLNTEQNGKEYKALKKVYRYTGHDQKL